MKTTDERAAAKAKLEEYLRKNKMRLNPKRFSVMESVCSYDGHFTVDELYASMLEKGEKISRATVYNTIDLLCKAEFVYKQGMPDGRTLYEYATKKRHCHCVCVRCGKIKEFSDDVLKTAIQTKRLSKFKQTGFSLCIYGICADCQKKEIDNNKRK